MAIDKDKNKEVLVMFPIELLKEIEDYQFKNRIKSRNEAIRIITKEFLKMENSD